MGKWDKYAEVSTSKWDKYAEAPAKTPVSAPAPAAPKEEPGFLMPGSKSEAAVRGFSQAATLGYGDEIQAALRSLFGDEKYTTLRDQERNANTAAAQANPKSYMAGGVAASIPSGAAGIGKTVGATALRSAGLGAVSGLGNSEAEDITGMGADALKGAAVQGTIGTVAKGAQMAPGVAKAVPAKVVPLLKDPTASGAAIGAVGSLLSGGSVVDGAILGGLAGRTGRGAIGTAVQKLSKVKPAPVQKVPVSLPGAIGMTTASASSMALRNLAGVQARQVVDAGNQKIQEAVNAGQPAYAAVFQELNRNTPYRVASEKVVKDGPEDGPDTEEDVIQEDD